jgi:hypothetical protein
MQERSDIEDDNDELQEPTVTGLHALRLPFTPLLTSSTVDNGDDYNDHREKRARNRDHTQYSRQWHPWTDRIVGAFIHFVWGRAKEFQTCTLDILMHLPRSVFSHRQLELFLWLLKVNNVDDVPSVKSM